MDSQYPGQGGRELYSPEQLVPPEELDPRVRELLEHPELAGLMATAELANLVHSAPAFRRASRDETARLLMLAMAEPGLVAMPRRLREELKELSVDGRAVRVA